MVISPACIAAIIATGSGMFTPYQSRSQLRIWSISRVWSAMIARARSRSSWWGAFATTGCAIITAIA
jgi:hypothetical protein